MAAIVERYQEENLTLVDLTSRMTQVLNQSQTQSHESGAQIGIKLGTLVSDCRDVYLRQRQAGIYNGDILQPQVTDQNFRKLRTKNAVVKGWLINSMDPSLISNFIRFLTTIEEDKVYTFLDGLDDHLDKIRGDVLQIKPFPKDILTKEIIGRGTKKEGLYYMDDFSLGRANNVNHTGAKEQQIWLWHRRLKHPSFGKMVLQSERTDIFLKTARALLTATHVPQRYWTDAVVTTTYLLNRMPSRILAFKTPLQVLAQHMSLPSVLMLPPRIFGFVAYVHLHKNQRTKLDPCAVRCIFLGYTTHQKGYRCYDPTTRILYTTMDVTFLESETLFPKQATHSSLQEEIQSKEQNWKKWPGFEDVSVMGNNEAYEAPITEGQPKEPMTVSMEKRKETEEVETRSELSNPDPLVPYDQAPENTPEVRSLNSSPMNIIDGSIG
ncbi:hypothetical protein RJ640_001935 [Escallonia rubra]|uniref:GAG-pre-integrase domain-containing protein n=1 Tax=Escallonia rubra TaxID=112253 RepID=A0AA88RU45_9ASTE|nr:hypothetical protein RJ640_001935 [Escallonia rubra]